MMSSIETIKMHLEMEFGLQDEQLEYELARFRRHTDIGAELAWVLTFHKFPKAENAICVSVNGVNYNSRFLVNSHIAGSAYGAYSLLTQLRDYPEDTARAIKNNFRTK